MYRDGLGVPQDYATAVTWYRKAAEKGLVEAQSQLGSMYFNGRGVPQDYIEALSWNRKAADRGNAISQLNLASMYFNGRGTPKDNVQAYMWSILALSRFPASPKEYRDKAVYFRDQIAAKMTPAQIAEAQKLAREWKPKPER